VGPYDETLNWGEDFELSLRLATKYSFTFDRLMTYGHRKHLASIQSKIMKAKKWEQQGRVLEKHLRFSASQLSSRDARDAYTYLFSCFVASGQRKRILRYGLSSREAFISMVAVPKRAIWNGESKLR
jgi:hypothetical protein